MVKRQLKNTTPHAFAIKRAKMATESVNCFKGLVTWLNPLLTKILRRRTKSFTRPLAGNRPQSKGLTDARI